MNVTDSPLMRRCGSEAPDRQAARIAAYGIFCHALPGTSTITPTSDTVTGNRPTLVRSMLSHHIHEFVASALAVDILTRGPDTAVCHTCAVSAARPVTAPMMATASVAAFT